MKFIRYILPGIFCLVLVVLSWPLAQASYGSANVTLKVNIIAPPSVTTNYARPIAHGRTVLHGCLISLGTASSVVAYFEWGETTEYGNTTGLRTMTRPGAFAAAIKGLNRGTAYHFRAVAVGDGTSYGSDKLFNCRECKGGVTSLTLKYNGTGPASIIVRSKKGAVLFSGTVNQFDTFSFNGTGKSRKLGSEIGIWVNGKLVTNIHTSCSQPIGPGLIVGDFEVVKGESLKGGALCPIPECEKCKGGVTSLTLKYNGTGPASIEVRSKKGAVLFSGTVNQSDTFSFGGTEKNGKLGSEIRIWVNGKLATKLHTSCSQPIGPGLIVGDFEVVKGESLKGGPLCPIPTTGEHWCWKWLWWRWW